MQTNEISIEQWLRLIKRLYKRLELCERNYIIANTRIDTDRWWKALQQAQYNYDKACNDYLEMICKE